VGDVKLTVRTRTGGLMSKLTPVHLVLSNELPLNAAVDAAWPLVVDYTRWQNYPLAEHVSGTPGEVGEVVILAKAEADFETPPYYTETICLEPNHRITWKIYPKEQAGEGGFLGADQFLGFVDFRVDPDGDRTRFTATSVYEYMISAESEEERRRFLADARAGAESMFASIFPKLQKLVDEEVGAKVA
jgi:hypothetical protein